VAAANLETHGLADLFFLEAGANKPTPFKDLPAQEWVLTSSKGRLSGAMADGGAKKFVVNHSFAGRLLGHENVRPSGKGEFGFDYVMRRGRNTFSFEFGGGEGAEGAAVPPRVFEFDVFFKGPVRNWIEPFVKIAIFFVLIQTFVIKAFFIPTGSMEDTFFPGDYLLVDRVSLLLRPPEAGDIIVFQYPKNFTQDFIKRLVGTPGDMLQMENKTLYRNGKRADEPWVVNKDYRRFAGGLFSMRDNWGPVTVAPECFFMMGDNRDYSKDSRFWGQLPAWRVKGRAWLRYMPLKRFGLLRQGRHVARDPS